MIVLDGAVKWVETFRAQLADAFVAVAGRWPVSIDPKSVDFVPRNDLADVVEFALHESFLAKTEFPEIRTIRFVLARSVGLCLGRVVLRGSRNDVRRDAAFESLLLRRHLFHSRARFFPRLVHHQPLRMAVRQFGI